MEEDIKARSIAKEALELVQKRVTEQYNDSRTWISETVKIIYMIRDLQDDEMSKDEEIEDKKDE